MAGDYNKQGKAWSGPPVWFWPLFFLTAWQLLLSAQNPGLMSDDSGEMIAAAVNLGLPHPPGYPIFDLLGRLISLIPVGTAAFRFNLLSGLTAMGCLGLMMASCVQLMKSEAGLFPQAKGVRSVLVAAAGASLLGNRSFFEQAMTAKGLVYMLSLAVISALFLIRSRASLGAEMGKKWYFTLFLFFLGLGNHWQTQILLVPFLLLWLFQDRSRWSPRKCVSCASLGLIALSPYLYLPLRASRVVIPDWGHPDQLHRFIWVVSRKLSSETEQAVRGWDHYLAWGGKYFSLMSDTWWPGFWVLGLLGLFHLARIDRKLLLSSLALYGTVLYALLTVARNEVLYLLNVYLVAIHGLFALWAFLGLTYLVKRLEEWGRLPSKVFIFFLAVVLAGWGWVLTWSEDMSRYTLAEDMGINVLKGIPRNGLLLAEGDHYVMPLFYQKYVQGLRSDLAFEPAVFLVHDWGWRQLGRQGEEYQRAVESSSLFMDRLKGAAKAALKQGGFHYSLQKQKLDKPLRELGGDWVPGGLSMSWSGGNRTRAGEADGLEAIIRGQRLRGLDLFEFSPNLDFSSSEIYLYYADQYSLASRFFASRGRWELAEDLFQKGQGMRSVSAETRAREYPE